MAVQQSKINLDEILNNLIEDENKRLQNIWNTHYKMADISKKLHITDGSLREYCKNHDIKYISAFSPLKVKTNYIDKNNLEKLFKLRGLIK